MTPTEQSSEAHPRLTGRVIVVDDRSRVLLFRIEHGDEQIWVIPGGASEPDETPAETGVRELREEVGVDLTIGEIETTTAPGPR